MFGAGNETRTRDPDLGKVVLYQLSYSRNIHFPPVKKCGPSGVDPKREAYCSYGLPGVNLKGSSYCFLFDSRSLGQALDRYWNIDTRVNAAAT